MYSNIPPWRRRRLRGALLENWRGATHICKNGICTCTLMGGTPAAFLHPDDLLAEDSYFGTFSNLRPSCSSVFSQLLLLKKTFKNRYLLKGDAEKREQLRLY
jgi:hypothetical protein